ncbi:MAG: tetratricopeptide repeat protein [Gammaproteobacteria bacterium]
MRKAPLLVLILLLVTGSAQADFNDGVVALMMGKYDDALQTLVPLAETRDHAYAQYFLGRMYADGQGVAKDPERAAEWYRKAAEQGVADAQFRLGQLYENGDGVPTDLEYAFGWYGVAAHLGNANGDEAYARTRERLSAEELVEAEKLAREFIQKYGKLAAGTARQQ